MLAMRMLGLPRKSIEEHREILDHLRRNDAEKTRDALKNHRQRAAKELLGILERFGLAQL
ncbi:MAG: FCD domain-containing protein [Rhodobacter sp.]|nr:FCD domain-containing protein [Rhodobacter sp.]